MGGHFAVMDAGYHGISLVSATWTRNGDYISDGFCRVGARGFRKGIVVDAAMATDSIAGALNRLREKTGKKIEDVYTAVSSSSIKLMPSSGSLLLSKYGREVTSRDVKRCVEIGSAAKIPLEKEPLHWIVRGFSLDGEDEIKNPRNLEGVKLESRVNILTIDSSIVKNMSKCISQAGFLPAGFVFTGLAAAHRVLSPEDKESGVALIDICRDITEVMIFTKGILDGCKVFNTGTGDIIRENGTLDGAKLEELVPKITTMPAWEKARKIIIVGGGALMHDMVELLETSFTIPVKAGVCISRPFEDLPPDRTGYIGSLGILDCLQQERQKDRLEGNLLKRGINRALSFIERYF